MVPGYQGHVHTAQERKNCSISNTCKRRFSPKFGWFEFHWSKQHIIHGYFIYILFLLKIPHSTLILPSIFKIYPWHNFSVINNKGHSQCPYKGTSYGSCAEHVLLLICINLYHRHTLPIINWYLFVIGLHIYDMYKHK